MATIGLTTSGTRTKPQLAACTSPEKLLPPKDAARSAKSQAPRGKTVTVMCAFNARGTYIPPMFIWQRVRMVDYLMNGAPPGSLGVANPSGWMDSETFLRWLGHSKC